MVTHSRVIFLPCSSAVSVSAQLVWVQENERREAGATTSLLLHEIAKYLHNTQTPIITFLRRGKKKNKNKNKNKNKKKGEIRMIRMIR